MGMARIAKIDKIHFLRWHIHRGRPQPALIHPGTITDTGRDISLEDQETIFEKSSYFGNPSLYSAGKQSSKVAVRSGPIPIANGIIEILGGAIWVNQTAMMKNAIRVPHPMSRMGFEVARILCNFAVKIVTICTTNGASYRVLRKYLDSNRHFLPVC
jgi:hypothetical protein